MNQTFLSAVRIGLVFLAGGMPLSVAAQTAPQRSGPATVVGHWEQVDDDGQVYAWFHIYEREGIYEGKIVKSFPKPGEPANAICTKCAGPEKNHPVIGLTLIKNMQRKGHNFVNGTIMDPRDGNVYQARMELSPDGQRLMLRGFVGMDLFGKSQIWRRLPESAMPQITSPGAPATKPVGQPVKR